MNEESDPKVPAGRIAGHKQQGGAAATRNNTMAAIDRLMRPNSVAIIGMSSRPGTPSANVLHNLLGDGYDGELYLVGRSGGTIEGRPCFTSIDDLPEGIDLAIMVVAASDARSTLEALIARKIKAAVCFASGFAETGEEGRQEQQELGRIAREAGVALVGPNCVGYYNYVNPFQAMFAPSPRIDALPPQVKRALAVVSQSGGMGHHLTLTLKARGVPISHMITTGNEASLGISDFISYLLDQPTTGVIVCYIEQIRRPADFLAVAERARAMGITILVFHPGRSAGARAATASHSGALVGDYDAMRTIVEGAGILVAETIEELLDVGQLIWRYPVHSGKGIGVVTGSGAVAVFSADYCDALGVDMPSMSKSGVEELCSLLPDYMTVRNPLDLGAGIAFQPEVVGAATGVMLADPAIGSVLICNPYVGGSIGATWARGVTSHDGDKPRIYVIHDEDVPLAEEEARILFEARMVVMRSSERAMRALARYTHHQRSGHIPRSSSEATLPTDLPQLGSGSQPEWLGKQLLAKIGIAVPDGGLAASVDEALVIASKIGFPVALKAQSASLAHKSDIGGVLLNIADESALRRKWNTLQDNIKRARPELTLDGVLVERMGERGVELVVGARRDAQWGPVVMVGLGGVLVEALGDVRLLPPTLSEEQIVEQLQKLKGAKLLNGFRGLPAVDVPAVARVVALVSRLMVEQPQIVELDVNPLVAHSSGVVALDALIVTRRE